MIGPFARSLAALAVVLGLSACAQTTRVDAEQTTPQALSSKGTGVAVMRLGAASHTCQQVQVLIGVREGNHFRGVQGVRVMQMRSVSESAVAEVELPPNEYHFLAYRCVDRNGMPMTVSDKADVANVYRTSIAKFSVKAGEVVNIGYLHYNAVKTRSSMFGRPIRQEVEVSDWPLEELERFRKNRPEIYARMTTRLMQVTLGDDFDTNDCDRLRQLQRDGKVAKLPEACTPAAKTARR